MNIVQEKTIKTVLMTGFVILILFIAFLLRRNTFWLAHWSGDQEIYLALAMKLDRFGLHEYNVRRVDVGVEYFDIFDGKARLTLGEVLPSKEGEKGYLLDVRLRYGLKHYDRPLYHIAPAFPFALMISNRLFSPDRRYRGAVMSLNKVIDQYKPPEYINAQFYAVIVPLFFGLLLILFTFILGKMIFSYRVGVYAAIMLTTNAVNILSSQRIWTDEMSTALLTLSIILFIFSNKYPGKFKHSDVVLPCLTGIILGLAALTRQTSALFLAVFFLFSLLGLRENNTPGRNWITIFLNKKFALILLGFICTTFFWFIRIYREYGTIIYTPDISEAVIMDKTGWVNLALKRPHPLLLFLVGIPYIFPPFLLIYHALENSVTRFIALIKQKRFEPLPFLWIWIIVFLLHLAIMGSILKEHRYLLPIYPPLAILAAYSLSKIKGMLSKRLGPKQVLLPEIIILVFLIISGMWSAPIGIYTAMINKSLILKPF